MKMCLNKKRYFTKKHILSLDHWQPGYIECDCGRCSECEQKRQNDYFLRSFFESKECIKKNGFVVFDTLTYDDANLPMIRDVFPDLPDDGNFEFSCFRRRDVQLFLKRLRKMLPVNSLRYFIASEYGTSDTYVDKYGNLREGTHRPHYHCIFFVTAPVDPCVFSRMVSTAWNLGRTDGVAYHGRLYFESKRLFKCQPEDCHFNNVISYVQKYCLKNSDFQNEIDRRLFYLASQWDEFDHHLIAVPDGFPDAEDVFCLSNAKHEVERWQMHVRYVCSHFYADKFRSFQREVSQFTLSSLGYGMTDVHHDGRKVLMKFPDIDFDMFEKLGCIRIVNKKKERKFSLPQYYFRKKYYETYINKYGKRAWRPNAEGIAHLARQFDAKVAAKRFSLLAAADNAGIVLSDSVLSGLVNYCVVYRGSIGDPFKMMSPRYDYLSRFTADLSDQVLYNHSSHAARVRYNHGFVSVHDYGVADAFDPPESVVSDTMSVPYFMDHFIYVDPSFESLLGKLNQSVMEIKQADDRVYFYRKKMRELLVQ